MKVKVLKFTKNHGFHGTRHLSRKKVNFTENVMAVKSWIKLVPAYYAKWTDQLCRDNNNAPIATLRRQAIGWNNWEWHYGLSWLCINDDNDKDNIYACIISFRQHWKM